MVGVTGDDATAPCRLDVAIERVVVRYVCEVWRGRIDQRPTRCQYHYLRQLRPRHQVTRSELQAVRAAGVSAHKACVIRAFDVEVEGVTGWYVSERRSGRRVSGNPEAQDHNLGRLASSGVIRWAVRVVRIPGDSSHAVQVPYA